MHPLDAVERAGNPAAGLIQREGVANEVVVRPAIRRNGRSSAARNDSSSGRSAAPHLQASVPGRPSARRACAA